jgi:hypothetical protein
MTIRGHYDGARIVLDEPVPGDVTPNTPVTVVFDRNGAATVLERLAKLARPGEFPADYAAQHDHYVKGLPKR